MSEYRDFSEVLEWGKGRTHREKMASLNRDLQTIEQIKAFLDDSKRNGDSPYPPGSVLMMKPKCKRTLANRIASMFGYPKQYEVTYEFKVQTP